MEADVIEGGIIQAILVLLHLGLDATDSSVTTFLAPGAVLSPVHAGRLQHRVTAAAELYVVDGRVVTKQTLMRLHANLERGEHTTGAVLRLGPATKAGQERRIYMSVKGRKKILKIRNRSKIWVGNTGGKSRHSTSEHLICNPGRNSVFISPLNMMGKCLSPASC